MSEDIEHLFHERRGLGVSGDSFASRFQCAVLDVLGPSTYLGLMAHWIPHRYKGTSWHALSTATPLPAQILESSLESRGWDKLRVAFSRAGIVATLKEPKAILRVQIPI